MTAVDQFTDYIADYQQWREQRLLNPDISIEAYQRELAAFELLEQKEESE